MIWTCTRCGLTDRQAKEKGCPRGPCPMVPSNPTPPIDWPELFGVVAAVLFLAGWTYFWVVVEPPMEQRLYERMATR